MNELRRQLGQGVFRQGWLQAGVSLALAVAVYGMSLGYDALNHGPYHLFLRTPLDQAMPVVPVFVVPYVSLDPLVYVSLVLFLVFRQRIFQSAALSMLATWVVSYLIYAVAQSYVDRPAVMGTDVFSAMVRHVYANDFPYNDFPSLHVSISTIIAIHWLRVDRRVGAVVTAWVVLIIASTQLIHQHYLADVAGGLVLAFAFSRLFGAIDVFSSGRGQEGRTQTTPASPAGAPGPPATGAPDRT